MYRILEYTYFFIIIILLQVFLFGSMNLSVYIHPLVYVAFLILLPLETPAVVILLMGLITGISMDFFTGAAGLNTIASVFTAFLRPTLSNMLLGRDEVKDGGIPTVNRIGRMKFFRYSSVLVLIHCFIYFSFESLSWDYYYLTLLRIVLSAVLTIILVWFSQMLLPGNFAKYSGKRDSKL